MLFLVLGRDAENIKKRSTKTKQTEQKHSKMKRKRNKEYKDSQITTTNIFGFTFYVEYYISLENIA